MNMTTHHDDPNIPADEWQSQERALRAERMGLSDCGDDDRVHEYRRIARALRQPLPDPLPSDFAERMAHRVGAAHSPSREGLDRVFGAALWLLLTAAGTAYGMNTVIAWWQALADWVPSHAPTSTWLLSLAACTALTGMLGLIPTLPGQRMRLG